MITIAQYILKRGINNFIQRRIVTVRLRLSLKQLRQFSAEFCPGMVSLCEFCLTEICCVFVRGFVPIYPLYTFSAKKEASSFLL